MKRSVLLALALFALAFTSVQPQTPPASGQKPPLITATTRMVQVSVIAKDNGSPAAGLKAEDFTVLADGRPQKISFFSVESTGVLPSAPPLPPDTFTNILPVRGGAVNGITVVLLDMVNTRLADRMYARLQLLKYLDQVDARDRVGVYVFSGGLRVLHEYTEDMSVFKQKLADAKNHLVTVASMETPGALDTQTDFDRAFMRGGASLDEREFFLRYRVLGTVKVLKFIADHLESLAGRKNLIWMSDGFPLQYAFANLHGMPEDYTDELDATVRALNQANVAIYPIDARGLTPPHDFDASRGSTSTPSGPRATASAAAVASPGELAAHATMNILADRTGGHAYFNTNDLAGAIHGAVADSAVTYTIGFYPVDEKGNREFHKIKIETPHRHLSLHYRSGYEDVPRAAPDEHHRLLQLRDAVFSPLDATELGLTVQATRAATAPGVDLVVTIQPDGILLKPDGDRYVGRLDTLIAQLDSRGHQIQGPAGTHDTIEMNLLPETYKKFATDGFPLRKSVSPSPRATSLRIVVRDAGSGMIGSLTVPLKQL